MHKTIGGKRMFKTIFMIQEYVRTNMRQTDVLQGVIEPVLIHDMKGTITYVNHAARKLKENFLSEVISSNLVRLGQWEAESGLQKKKSMNSGIYYSLMETDNERMMHVDARILRHEDGMYILTVISNRADLEHGSLQRSRYDEVIRQTIKAMTAMTEIRDPYTASHQNRVAHLAYAIAVELGFTEEQANGVFVSAMLHDIGKLYVPIEILVRPGCISEYEFNIIKKHSQMGYDILHNIDFPWPVSGIILQHHERLDGSGYPLGLTEHEILPQSKVLCVADVVEAMASHRPYRPALGIEKALEEIDAGRGLLYDADIVDICISLFNKSHFSMDECRTSRAAEIFL